ncbi:MAG: hypothetical protein ACI96P_001347 [Candidatus Azotimanducaceae bacterium]|jgi:hypothetical protein
MRRKDQNYLHIPRNQALFASDNHGKMAALI